MKFISGHFDEKNFCWVVGVTSRWRAGVRRYAGENWNFEKIVIHPCKIHRWKAEHKCGKLVKKFLKSDHFWQNYGQFMAAQCFTRTMTSWCSPRQCRRRRLRMFTIFDLQTHLDVRKSYTKNGLHITFFVENNKRGSNWPPPQSSQVQRSPVRVGLKKADFRLQKHHWGGGNVA